MTDENDTEVTEADEAPAKKKTKGGIKSIGAGPAVSRFERQGTNDADIIWNQMVEWLPNCNDPALPTRSPYDVMITVKRTHPPHPSGEAQAIGRGFSGSAVMGGPNELPGNSLINFVMKYYHLPTTDQPASYDVYFWKKAGGQITVGRLPMPSGPECRAALRAAEQSMIAEGGGPGLGWEPGKPPGGFGGFPPQPPPPAPWGPPGLPWSPPPPGLGWYPPPAPAPDTGQQQQLAYLTGALQEALAAAREGRQPMIPPPPPVGIAAPPQPPPPPPVDEDRIVSKVLAALGKAGIGVPAPTPVVPVAAPVTAPPPASTVNGLGQMMEKAMVGMAENLIKTAFGVVEKNLKTGMGLGAPGEAPAAEEPEEPKEPEKPEDIVPWKIAPVGAAWGGGSPVQVAINKETGDIDPMGLAFANPVVAEKVIDTINGLGAALQEGIRNFSAKRAPALGAGAAPAVPAAPPPIPPAPPPPPAVEPHQNNVSAPATSSWGAPVMPST